MKSKPWPVCFAVLFLLLCNPCFTQEKLGASLTFKQLPRQEQILLQAAAQLWPKLDPTTQAQLREQAQSWSKLSIFEQQTVLLSEKQWDSLSYAEKTKKRVRYAAWKSLGISEQAKISAAYRQWQTLPSEQQQALKAKFAQQLPEYQAAWLLGPSLGADAHTIHDWLLFVPPEQINPWLMLLRQLSAEDRADLGKLSKLFNQRQRDAFRSRLLNAPVGERTDRIQGALNRQ